MDPFATILNNSYTYIKLTAKSAYVSIKKLSYYLITAYYLIHPIYSIHLSFKSVLTQEPYVRVKKVRKKSSVNPIGTVNHTSELYQYSGLFDFLMRARGRQCSLL